LLALVLVGVSVGLSNFAGAIGIGVAGASARTKVEVAIVFGAFEIGMPLLGLAVGRHLAHDFGGAARWVGGGLLIAAGLYALVSAVGPRARARAAAREAAPVPTRRGQLLVLGLALSIDNLAIGFALGTYHVAVVTAAVVIGAVSVGLSLIGLELGARIGVRAGNRAELFGSVVLIVVGALIGAGAL
jgi:putative Mn2+ efflux pump MntP